MNTCERLYKLDKDLNSIESLLGAVIAHNTTPSITQGINSPLGTITPNTVIDNYPQEKLRLLHSLLHLFHSSKTGKGLENKDIVSLHSKVKERLSNHKYFDRLDNLDGEVI